MGSFVLRNFLKDHSQEVDGAIIMGTGGKRFGLAACLPFLNLLNKLAPEKPNKFIDNLAFGSYANNFKDSTRAFDWLSVNKQNVTDYIEDPLLGFTFTNNGFYTLFSLINGATKRGWFRTIRHDLPTLIISGRDDPVGQMGKGPNSVTKELVEDNFSNVSLKLLPELRHEVLNESNKTEVYQILLNWLNQQLS